MDKKDVNLYIGVDPSITSTGMCIRVCDVDGNDVVPAKFHIIHKGKLTKKEKAAEEEHAAIFMYHPFEEHEKDDDISKFEMLKTRKLIEVAEKMKEIIQKAIKEYENDLLNIYVCIEGISYGSVHGTKSIFDLAGLNYMMRYMLMKMDKYLHLIVAPPSVIKKFATGNGAAKKDLMIATFSAIYPNFTIPKVDDIVDAYFMSRWAQKWFEQNM